MALTSEHSAHDAAEMGNACLAVGDFESAAGHYTRAIEIQPTLLAAYINLGVAHLHQSDLPAARATLTKASKLDPTSIAAWANLGAVYHQSGDDRSAVEAFEAALRLDPDNASIHSGLGASHTAVGNTAAAREHLQRSVALDPNSAPNFVNQGNFHTRHGEYGPAEQAYETAIALDPGNTNARCNLSVCLKEAGRYVDAAVAAWKAHRHDPHGSRNCAALGTALLNTTVESVPCEIADATHALVAQAGVLSAIAPPYREALAWLLAANARAPNETDTIRNIASAYEQAGDLETARDWFGCLLSLRPSDGFGLSRLVDITLTQCDWRAYDIFKNRLVTEVERQLESGDNIAIDVINLIALPVTNDFTFRVSQHKSAQAWERLADARQRTSFSTAPRRDDNKIRLGYLLPYTRFTSMTQALADIVSRHDRDRFQVIGYCVQKAGPQGFEKQFRGAFDTFRDVPGTRPEGAAQAIHDDAIDILIDTTGHTTISCLPILAMRPAPVQAHYLGYGLTTGASFVDYLITDQTFTPPELRATCSEELVYLPHSFLPFSPGTMDECTVSRSDCGLPEDGVVFCNFNQPAKFEPIVFSLWMQILKSVPDSVLWLGNWNDVTRGNLRREAEARGIAAERLVFADIVPHARHLKRLQLADIALDTLFHGGGVTSTDVLWAGVPLLTCAGDTPQSRLGASLVTALGLTELITDDHHHFAGTAIELAQDPAALGYLRDRLQQRRTDSPLFNQERYVRDLEKAFETMWSTFLQSKRGGHE